jgi:hypothetical protein
VFDMDYVGSQEWEDREPRRDITLSHEVVEWWGL